jgi:hypothetical protein
MFRAYFYRLFFDSNEPYHYKLTWRLFIGEAQVKMNWVYTQEEVKERLKKLKDNKK